MPSLKQCWGGRGAGLVPGTGACSVWAKRGATSHTAAVKLAWDWHIALALTTVAHSVIAVIVVTWAMHVMAWRDEQLAIIALFPPHELLLFGCVFLGVAAFVRCFSLHLLDRVV